MGGRVVSLSVVVVCAAVGGLLVPSAASGQEAAAGDVEVRVVARRAADGRVEFGVRQRLSDDTWGEAQLPSRRYFPTSAVVGRWLQSSPVSLSATAAVEVRVVARRAADGRVEFGLRHRFSDDAWGEAQLPSRRFFPTSAVVGRWLQSSPVTIAAAVVAGEASVAPTNPEAAARQREFASVAVGDTDFACGLRVDGSVRCWGSTLAGFSPGGVFSALGAGARVVCGIRVDEGYEGIECWGPGIEQAAPPPPGRYVGVGVGEVEVCGIHAGGRLECWDRRGETWWQPEGQFQMVEVVIEGSACGLRSDGVIVCAEHGRRGPSPPPEGAFSTIDLTDTYGCGVRVGGELACWGELVSPSYEDIDESRWVPPEGQFVDVTAHETFACAVRADGEIACWGRETGCFGYDLIEICGGWAHDPIPPGPFTQIDAGPALWGGPQTVCGVRADGRVVCWNDGIVELARPPSGRFITVDSDWSCGIRVGGEAVCWGRGGERVVAAGPFTAIDGTRDFGCGLLRSSGQIACWGSNEWGAASPPPGRFRAVYAGPQQACALRVNGELVCWGRNFWGQDDLPPGPFIALAGFLVCGLRPDGEAECWGPEEVAQAAPLPGPFTALALAFAHAAPYALCGLRVDGEAVCWGSADRLPADPAGLFAVPDVEADARWKESHPGGSFETIDVRAGSLYACGIRHGGEVVCWSPAWPPDVD